METEGRGISSGRFRAVKGVALKVGKDELQGLLCANRSGKRTVPDIVPELFLFLSDHMDKSGGLQQRPAVVRALPAEPDLVLLDETNEGIQLSTVEEIERVILRMSREFGPAVILVEQSIGLMRRAASVFAMLQKGRVVIAARPMRWLIAI